MPQGERGGASICWSGACGKGRVVHHFTVTNVLLFKSSVQERYTSRSFV